MTEQDKRLVDNTLPEVLAEHFALLTAVCDREKDPIRKLIWLGLAKQAKAVAENAVQKFKERANG